MRKTGATLIIISLILIPLCQAQEESFKDGINKLEEEKEKIENIADSKINQNFLTNEWTEFLKEKKFFNWIYKLNPLFKFLFGYEFSLSWAFITALLLWTIIFITIWIITEYSVSSRIFAISISIPISVITAQIIIPKTINKLSNLIINIWQNLGLIASLIIAILLLPIITKYLNTKRKNRIQEKAIQTIENEAIEMKKQRQELQAIKKGSTKN